MTILSIEEIDIPLNLRGMSISSIKAIAIPS
jgi:hypothetical protein